MQETALYSLRQYYLRWHVCVFFQCRACLPLSKWILGEDLSWHTLHKDSVTAGVFWDCVFLPTVIASFSPIKLNIRFLTESRWEKDQDWVAFHAFLRSDLEWCHARWVKVIAFKSLVIKCESFGSSPFKSTNSSHTVLHMCRYWFDQNRSKKTAVVRIFIALQIS